MDLAQGELQLKTRLRAWPENIIIMLFVSIDEVRKWTKNT